MQTTDQAADGAKAISADASVSRRQQGPVAHPLPTLSQSWLKLNALGP